MWGSGSLGLLFWSGRSGCLELRGAAAGTGVDDDGPVSPRAGVRGNFHPTVGNLDFIWLDIAIPYWLVNRQKETTRYERYEMIRKKERKEWKNDRSIALYETEQTKIANRPSLSSSMVVYWTGEYSLIQQLSDVMKWNVERECVCVANTHRCMCRKAKCKL